MLTSPPPLSQFTSQFGRKVPQGSVPRPTFRPFLPTASARSWDKNAFGQFTVRRPDYRPWQHLVDIVEVDDAVEAFVDVVEHVHHFHRGAVLAQSGEADDVAEIYGHFLVQLRFHHAALLQAFHHRPAWTQTLTSSTFAAFARVR